MITRGKGGEEEVKRKNLNIFKNNVNEQRLQQQATSEARLILENLRECPSEIELCVQGQSIHITGYQ